MKKRTRHEEPDINVMAKAIVDAATQGQNPTEDAMKAVMREMGRRGGLKGGKARAAKLSSGQKSSIARHAAKIRWESRGASK